MSSSIMRQSRVHLHLPPLSCTGCTYACLVSHSGLHSPPIDALTHEGYDMPFGTNLLASWRLTQLLLPALRAASTPTAKARMLDLSSNGAYLASHVNYATLRDDPAAPGARAKLGQIGLYNQSKLASAILSAFRRSVVLIALQGNALISRELARRHGGAIVAIALHPGVVQSELVRHWHPYLRWILVSTTSDPLPLHCRY
jgi:retinol dehydrogenase 12